MIDLPDIKGKYKYNTNISKYSYFKTGGVADILFIPADKNDLIHFIKNYDKDLKINVIGAGSNLLIKDSGVRGIVILTENLKDIKLLNNGNIYCNSGVLGSRLYNFAKNKGYSGYEFLGLIPGTIGGACKMNAGCYGMCIKDILLDIETIDLNGNIKTYSVEECNMEYRKNNLPNDLIFLGATFKKTSHLDKKTIESNFKELLMKKISSQPINEKTCGSTFKNLEDISAWKVVKELGFQGVDYNGVRMSEKNANFLINSNGNSTKIENLIRLIQEKARKERHIELELEIKIIE